LRVIRSIRKCKKAKILEKPQIINEEGYEGMELDKYLDFKSPPLSTWNFLEICA